MAEMRMFDQDAEITYLRQNQTRFIVREETDVEPDEARLTDKQRKAKEAEENQLYFMGYFKWYWGKHGFFSALKAFFGRRLFNGVVYSIFNSIGLAIGAFMFKRLVLARFGLLQYCK